MIISTPYQHDQVFFVDQLLKHLLRWDRDAQIQPRECFNSSVPEIHSNSAAQRVHDHCFAAVGKYHLSYHHSSQTLKSFLKTDFWLLGRSDTFPVSLSLTQIYHTVSHRPQFLPHHWLSQITQTESGLQPDVKEREQLSTITCCPPTAPRLCISANPIIRAAGGL